MYQVVIKDISGYWLWDPFDFETGVISEQEEEHEYILLDHSMRGYILINPVLTIALNRTGGFSFGVPYNHPNRDKIDLLRSVIKVYSIKNNTKKWIYSGRATTSEEDFYKTGKISCEGILSYLIDSRVRPYSFSGSPADYIDQLRQQHNSQVGAAKQFLRGDIDIIDADNNNYIVRESSGYPNTLDEISDKVIEPLSVYISARDEDDGLYLDCVSSLPHNTQKIKFGKNLLDLIRKKDATTIYTAVIPLGAEVDAGADGESSGKRLTIQYYCPDKQPDDWEVSYTDYCTRSGSEDDGYSYTFLTGDQAPEWQADTYYYGLDYVYDRDMRDAYDMIFTPVKFDDVTLQSNLFRKGVQALRTCLLTDSLSVSAADLSLTADDVEAFILGWVTLESIPHGLSEEMILSEMQIPLLDPLSANFTIGSTIETLTEKTNRTQKYLNEQIASVKSVAKSAVDNATGMITGANGGYVIIDRDEESGYPWRILVMDTPSTADAVNLIQINKNGIGFSTSGINGPYKNAWTIDGRLVAEFVTAANLTVGTVGGWSIEESLIWKEVDIDGYTYQIAMQAPDGKNSINCYYVRRRQTDSDGNWEYLFAIGYDGKITIKKGELAGWALTENEITQRETITIDGTDYVYQVGLQSVSDDDNTLNHFYIRRYPSDQEIPADASGWEYIFYINKYGNLKCQKLRARKSLQYGRVSIAPSAADTPTSVTVKFSEPMSGTPAIVATASSSVPGTVVKGIGVTGESNEGFTLWLTRGNTAETSISWVAFVD